MDRRTYCRSLGVASAAAIGGCLGSVPGMDDSQTVLDPPEKTGDPIYPVHGEAFPSFSLPDPLNGEEVALADLEGERAFLMTYFFTSCPDGACPALLLRLRRAQADAAERGYDDDLALLALTFDPDRDTPAKLETYADNQGVDRDAGNWHFLRPESTEESLELLNERFGVPVELLDEESTESDEDDGSPDEGGDGNATGADTHDADGHDGQEGDDHDHGAYDFRHYNLVHLVNDEGIVERAYPNATGVDVEEILDDVRTVVNG